MCGIVACFHHRSGRPVDPERMRAMAAALAHRGPDGAGEVLEGALGLAHRRLAVLDLPGGAQPIWNEAGDLALVANGEIYGHRALRRELMARGHVFRTAGDAEVVLHLYEERGDGAVEALRGEFAFALWDRRRRRLLAARDRMGVKPLCWTETADGLLLASEEKALLRHPEVPARADAEAVHQYLLAGVSWPPRTLFAGIQALPPGHLLTCDAGGVRLRRYWEIPLAGPAPGEVEAAVERAGERLAQAVVERLDADVPVGAALSGGLDTSAIVALAARAGTGPLPTFTVRYASTSARLAAAPGSRVEAVQGDDADYAAEVARAFGTEHHLVEADAEALEADLDTVIRHRDRPPVAVIEQGHLALFRAARRRVKVLLSGEGGDEVFGGYFYWLLRRGPENTDTFPWVWRAPAPLPLARAATSHDLLEACLTPAGPGPREALDDEFRSALARAPSPDFTNRLLHLFMTLRLPDFLAIDDRLSMAQGVEARVPLADAELVELVAGIPSRRKIGSRGEKLLLRDGPGRALPERVRARPKSPFPVPAEAAAFRARARALLAAPGLHVHRWLDAGALRRLADPAAGPDTPARREAIFRAWALERWHALFRVEA